jgi:predicted O-methyltransferase YrrM
MIPAWFIRIGGEVRLAAARRQAIAVDRLGQLADVDLNAAFRDPLPPLPIDDLRGAANPGDRLALSTLAAYLRPKRILEIGTHIGASTAALASVADVVTVDILDVNARDGPWRGLGTGESPAAMMERLGLSSRVHFVRMPSLSFLQSTPDRFDLVFLDGDHAAVTVYREVAAATGVLRPGGFILLHDYFPEGKSMIPGDSPIPGPYRALVRARREAPNLDVRPLGALPWPTKLSCNLTTLAIVGRR